MKVITVLLLSFLAAPVFAQCNITSENKLPKLDGSWKETDNALIRAQQRKRYLQSNFVLFNSGYSGGISDADAMSEIYTLATHEICGTVTAYEETPDVIHYQSKVRNDQGQKWETKDAAEKAVQDSCDPKPAGSWPYYIQATPALGGWGVNTPAFGPWIIPGTGTVTY